MFEPKVGDHVCLYYGRGLDGTVAKVTHATKTTYKVEYMSGGQVRENTFSASSLKQYGSSRAWFADSIGEFHASEAIQFHNRHQINNARKLLERPITDEEALALAKQLQAMRKETN